MSTDRIEKTVVLRAPRSRVWRAITNAGEFGSWFGVKLEGGFAPGARVTGRITIPGYEHVIMGITIERVEPEQLFSYRWHPYAIEPGVAEGTRLTVTESGFDRIPVTRRAEAFRMNDQGWAGQLKNIERYVGT